MREKEIDFLLEGTVYQAMKAGKQNVKAKKGRINAQDLPWPLSVPWPGSFLKSSKPERDYLVHAIFADIEVEIVFTR